MCTFTKLQYCKIPNQLFDYYYNLQPNHWNIKYLYIKQFVKIISSYFIKNIKVYSSFETMKKYILCSFKILWFYFYLDKSLAVFSHLYQN